MITIDARIPYNVTGNLGASYNDIMRQTTSDVVLLVDHDIFQCNPHWHHVIQKIMTDNPSIGMLTCWTNRIGNGHQRDTKAPKSDSIAEHRTYARILWARHKYAVSDILSCSGMLMALRVQCWREVGLFNDGFFDVDSNYSKRIAASYWRLSRAEGLYVYHLRDRDVGSWIDGQPTSMSFLPK